MEYVLVRFEQDREVVIDGSIQGKANLVIELERGRHIISLKAPPFDFKPRQRKILLKDTTSLSPMEVCFEKIEE